MTHDPSLPLTLQRAQMALWMRTGELLQDNGNRWLTLAQRLLDRGACEARAEASDTADAAGGAAPDALPMAAGWRLLNDGLCNARDMTLTVFSSQAVLDAGLRRALAQWQVDSAQALSTSRNRMPFNSAFTDLMQAAAAAPVEPAGRKLRR